MIKELTPLVALKEIGKLKENGCYINTTVEYKIVEKALKRLENYEKNEDFYNDVINYAYLSEQDKIKKLKALEIIKEKPQIEIAHIQWRKIKTYDEYLKRVYEWDNIYEDMKLTQEEFELLKEVLL